MIRIGQIKISTCVKNTESALLSEIKRILKVNSIDSYEIVKRSIDARKKPELFWVYSVDVCVKNEQSLLKKCRNKQVTLAKNVKYVWPEKGALKYRPVIVGMGPAGLFCGYMLAKAGAKPLIYERGCDVDKRSEDVDKFWKTGVLDTRSNVQFGEGGAGTFSDGKLTTLVNDKFGRNRMVLDIFVENGAPENIKYDGKPHIGTDILKDVVKNMRNKIIELGGEVHFETALTDIDFDESKGTVTGIFENGDRITTDSLVLAIGHSARDTFETLLNIGVPMESKAFALGMRVQHPQKMIDEAQYGTSDSGLMAAPYKLTFQSSSGRGVYSFCMCPGGYVVNASSEEGRLAINGMSYNARDSKVANSAIIMTVSPKDFGSDEVLAGLEYQRMLESRAFELAKGKIPFESYKDFKASVNNGTDCLEDSAASDLNYRFKGLSQYAPVHKILDEELNRTFIEGMESFDRVINGFASDKAVIAGIESRTSSPVRINRDETHMSKIRGIYPCGEGAGYAGGIMSAAMDGMLIAEEIWKK